MKNIRTLLQQARYKMWEEPTNSVGTGANVALPPAHEPPGIPASKKKKKYDGRTKAGRKLVNRILSNREKRAKKKMAQEQHIIEADDKKVETILLATSLLTLSERPSLNWTCPSTS